MQDFLSEYINTLSSQRRERVYDLLRAAKTDKSNLDNIALRLANTRTNSPLSVGSETFAGPISNSKFNGAYTDIIERFMELYEVSNDVSLMLDTHTSVLTSEIKALEDEIMAMTKAINNYAFTLADNGAYDFSFIETFSDDTMRFDADPTTLTDRSGINFRPGEGCYVNSASGILTLAPALENSYPLAGQIVNSNCAGFITSDTGLTSALNSSVGNGWRVSISAPRPISSTLGGNLRQGAQFEIELLVVTPSPSDNIVVTPFSEKPFEILKLEVFSSEDEGEESKLTLINGLSIIDKPTDFGFPLRTVTRVKILLNQPVYRRGQLSPYQPEETHRKLYSDIRAQTSEDASTDLPLMYGVYRRNQKALMRTILYSFNKSLTSHDTRIFKAQIPHIDFDPNRGPMGAYDFIRNDRKNYAPDQLWKGTSQVNAIFRRMIHEKVFSNTPEVLSGRLVHGPLSHFFTGGRQLNSYVQLASSANAISAPKLGVNVTGEELAGVQTTHQHFLNYQYDMGFRNIEIGRGQRVFRGVFVTKSLPANSDSGEVKMKTDDVDFLAINSDRDSKLVTSIEYSITNQSDPKLETDWIPIQPTNLGADVRGERIFFNEGGSAMFRFAALSQGDIRIYRNGYAIDFSTATLVLSTDGQAIKGIRMPTGTLNPNDIFTIDYTTNGDQTIINFNDEGFERASLASAFDENGAGESFVGTYNSRSIQLSNEVYLDYDEIKENGSYSQTLGFQGTYQPITILLADGSIAQNHTNYLGLGQNNLTEIDESITAYIHSGRNITFNQPIHSRFSVYYQYLPSNLKARIVLRVNDLNYVSPQVNSMQIKTKTRKSNAKREV